MIVMMLAVVHNDDALSNRRVCATTTLRDDDGTVVSRNPGSSSAPRNRLVLLRLVFIFEASSTSPAGTDESTRRDNRFAVCLLAHLILHADSRAIFLDCRGVGRCLGPHLVKIHARLRHGEWAPTQLHDTYSHLYQVDGQFHPVPSPIRCS